MIYSLLTAAADARARNMQLHANEAYRCCTIYYYLILTAKYGQTLYVMNDSHQRAKNPLESC